MIAKKTLKASVKAFKDFAKKHLPDETLQELDARDECPLEIVRHMCSPDKLGIQLLFIPEEFGGFGGGAFDVYCVCEEMARIDLGVATAVLATFLGSDPDYGRRHAGAEEALADAHRGRGIVVCLRRHRTERGQRSGGAGKHRGPGDAGRQGRRLQNQWQQAMDLERWDCRCLHDFGEHARRSQLVRGGKGRAGFQARRAGRQARHPPQQHRRPLAHRRLRRCRPAYRRCGRAGTDPGAGRVRLHAADGGGVWPGSRLGRARSSDTLFHQAYSSGSAALGKAGIHAQADRAERGPAGGRRAPTSKKPPSASTPAKEA